MEMIVFEPRLFVQEHVPGREGALDMMAIEKYLLQRTKP